MSEDDGDAKQHARGKGGVRRLLSGFTRVVNLQYRIWLTRLKMVAIRAAVATGLLIAALIFSVMAIIFLCIGVFHVLTDVAGLPEWRAFLIFGGLLALVAIIFVMVVAKMLTRTEPPDDARTNREGDQ